MIFLKTEDEIELLRQSNLLVGKTLAEVAKLVKPGVTTLELDTVAEEFIRDNGAIPTFKGFPNPNGKPFPATLCTSVNEQVVHGIPNKTILKDGDIVSVDCGVFMNGFCVPPKRLLKIQLTLVVTSSLHCRTFSIMKQHINTLSQFTC